MAKGKTGEPGRSGASVFKAIDDLLRTPGDVSLGKARPLKEEDLAEFEALAGGTRSCASADCTTTPCGRAGARPSPVEQTQQTCGRDALLRVRPTDDDAERTRGSASLPVEPTQQACGRDALLRVRPPDDDAERTRGSASLPVRHSPSKNSVLTKGFRTNVLFVTVCVKNRDPIFRDPSLVNRLVEAWTAAQAWHVGHYVVMPDHVHFVCTPNGDGFTLHKWIAYWKSLFSRGLGREEIWQRGCWDTQIRTGDDYVEKIEYMKLNPVRKGLSERPEDWPHQGIMHEITWHD